MKHKYNVENVGNAGYVDNEENTHLQRQKKSIDFTSVISKMNMSFMVDSFYPHKQISIFVFTVHSLEEASAQCSQDSGIGLYHMNNGFSKISKNQLRLFIMIVQRLPCIYLKE